MPTSNCFSIGYNLANSIYNFCKYYSTKSLMNQGFSAKYRYEKPRSGEYCYSIPFRGLSFSSSRKTLICTNRHAPGFGLPGTPSLLIRSREKIKKEMTTYRFQITYLAELDCLVPDSVGLSADCLSRPCHGRPRICMGRPGQTTDWLLGRPRDTPVLSACPVSASDGLSCGRRLRPLLSGGIHVIRHSPRLNSADKSDTIARTGTSGFQPDRRTAQPDAHRWLRG